MSSCFILSDERARVGSAVVDALPFQARQSRREALSICEVSLSPSLSLCLFSPTLSIFSHSLRPLTPRYTFSHSLTLAHHSLPVSSSETLFIHLMRVKLPIFLLLLLSLPPFADLNMYFHLIFMFTVKQTCLYKYVFSSSRSRKASNTHSQAPPYILCKYLFTKSRLSFLQYLFK